MAKTKKSAAHMAEPGTSSEVDERRYRAPALEKGLDILALLSHEPAPLTLTAICQRLERSHGEIFRMLQVLQFRNFIDQDPETDGYVLTDLLFSMAMRQPPTLGLVEEALPTMRHLSTEIGQSCHLAFHSRGDIVVVARMESIEQIGFSVRVGYRRPITRTVSGTVLFAFQPEDIQTRWLTMIDPTERGGIDSFLAHVDETRHAEYGQAKSSFVAGVTDISAPVLRGERAAAALTVPYIKTYNPEATIAQAVVAVRTAAADISARLTDADSRV